MKLEHALKIAESLKRKLEPYTECIEIGGSIRRKKPDVKDIELVAIPKIVDMPTGQHTLEGLPVVQPVNWLSNELHQHHSVLKGGDKYIQIGVFDEQILGHRQYIKVDVFTATPETWGHIFMIRTGPREFSKWVVTELKRRGCTPKDGAVWVDDIPSGQIRADIASENAMFRLLGIDYVEPEDRGRAI